MNIKDARALIDERDVCEFFEAVLAEGVDSKRAAAMLLNYGAKRANEQACLVSQLGISPAQIKEIADLVTADKISSTAADELFGHCCDLANVNRSALDLAQQHGLLQVSDTSELEGFIDQVLANPKNAKAVDDIRGGKDKAIGALLGQVMKLSGGRANPKVVGDLIKQRVER